MKLGTSSVQNIFEKWATRATIIWILKAACICLFLSRSWEHIFRDAPFRELFWKDSFITPFLNFFNYPQKDWYLKSDPYIVKIIQFIGVTYLACAFSAFKINKLRSVHSLVIVWGILNLLLLTYLNYLSKIQTLGIFIEFTIQWSTPLFLLWFLSKPDRFLSLAIKISIALTFTGHGLYAVGYYQVPGDFIAMVNTLTPINEWGAIILFLKIAGIMDFIISVGIFIPKIQAYCLGYAVVWGIFTALARYSAFFDRHMVLESTSAWLHETVVRLPHGLLPLVCVLIMMYLKERERATEVEEFKD